MAHFQFSEFNEEVESFSTFFERLEQFLILEDASEDKKKAYLLTLIGAKAYEFLKTLCSPELPKNKTFEELTEKLNTHFSPKRSIIVQRFIFFKWMQETEESISQYLVAIKRLAATCEFGNFLEDSLRDKFVCGLSDSRIQKKILSEGDVSLARVMEIALSMEAAEQNIKLFHAGELEKSVDKLRFEMQRESKNGKRKCKHCGNLHRDSCRFKDAVCFKCRKKGHIAPVCRNHEVYPIREQASQQNRIHQMDDQGETEELIQKITCMRTPHDYRINTTTSDPPYTIRLKVEKIFIDFELDTGSCLTLISENDFKKYLLNAQLKTIGMIIKQYDGTVVPILGEVIVKVEFQGKTSMLRAVVVKGEKKALLGREWINLLKIDYFAENQIPSEIAIAEFLKEHQVLFNDTAEPIKGFTFSMNIRDVSPIFHKARPVPFAIRTAVTEALENMVTKGYLYREIKDLESENKAIVESKNIHGLKLFQQEVNERKISLNQVINTLLESELDDTQYDDYSKAKKDIFNMLVSIEEALSLIETKENTHSDKQLPESNVNLPKINLPIFNGDSANWLSFREIFNSTINSNQTLTEIQKFQYLNASVKGPAEKLIRGFPISDKNYQQAWDTLCNRFNNRRELAFSQINKIFSIRPLKSISAGSLYEILDVCNEGIRNLSVLGLEKNTLTDLILINFFEKRIGEALRKEWELTLQNEEYPTFENFVNFLEKHARSLQGMRIPLFQEQKTSSKNMMAHGLYVNKGQNCILCHQIHKLNDCQRFINLPLPKKWELVKKHKLCQNCLRANHEISKCLITSRCKNCKQNHHTLLHEYNSEPSIPQPTTSQEMLISTNTICNAMPLETETNILLSTALIKVKAKDGSFVLCRALVDNGSQISLISEQCCHKLGLEKRKNSYTLKGVGDIVVNRTTSQVEIEFTPHHNDQLFSARAFVVGRVTADLPNFQIQSADFPHLENLLLADPEFYVTKPIDLILGADTFVEIILGHKTDLKHHPIALNTKLGWLVSGRIHSTIKSNTSVINHCTTELDSSIREFWELEDVPISKAQLGTKNACEILFKSNLKRDIEGRYSVNLPFKSTPNLGDSRSQALEKGLQENPSKSEDNSSKSEENLSRSEDNPSKSEEIPSKSKKSHISKLTPQITSKQNQLLPSESSQPSTPEQPLASQSSEPLSSKKETSIIPKIKPPPYYRRKRQLPAEKTSWDEPIESDIKSNWNKFQTQLSCLKEIKIPRYLNSSSSEIEELQLHGFCDASLNAYSAVFYLKTRFKIQKIKINLITSKTKVAPLKTITIPRLELSAALLLAQLNQVILESFPFQPDKTFLWTDSQICIDWIRSDASRWKAFVSNRVSSIQNLTQITDWFHVSSQDNPADCASRGIMPQDLVNHRIWWRDTQGLLRVGGRLKYSYLNENQNFPLLQPKSPRQESLIKNLLTENADIPEAIDENQEDSSILETTFVIEDEESNKDIGTPKIEISEVSVIDNSEGKYSKEPVVSAEALDKKELCHDDSAHLNVVEADLNRPKEATSGIINISTEANESASKEKAVSVEIVDTSTKDYLQSGEKAKLSRWKPIDSLCLEDVKESEDDDENYSSSAYIEWPEILKKEVLRPEALEKAVNLEDFEKVAESRQLSKEHLEESTEQGSCIKAESKTWEDPIESDLAAAETLYWAFPSNIHPNLESRVKEQQARQMKYDHGFQQDEFGIDDMVWCRNFRGGERWIPGRIMGRKGSRVYTVLIHGQVKSYHRDKIRKRWEYGGDDDRQYGRQREETDIIVPEADMPNRGRSESPPIETARQQRDSGLVEQNDGGISGESARSSDPEA
ncbi:hypothetical protein LAZ67_22001069, partial [Cordylochernes scorpioides]